MESILKSDIFFFITSLAVIVLALISTIILFYIIKLIKHIEYIANKVRIESDNIANDIADVRTKFKEGSMKMGGLAGTVAGFASKNFTAGILNYLKKKATSGGTKRRSTSKARKVDEEEFDTEDSE